MKGIWWLYVVLVLLYLPLHFYVWLIPNNIYQVCPHFDKIEHFISGLIIGGVITLSLPHRETATLMFLVLFLGVLFEVAETCTIYTGGPTDTILDLATNQLGALIAIIVTKKFSG